MLLFQCTMDYPTLIYLAERHLFVCYVSKVDFHVLMTLISTLATDLELALGSVVVAALITSVRVPMFSKAPTSADQARSKGSGGGQQHEPVQPSAKGPVSHCYPTLPFIDAIQACLLMHTVGLFDGK